MFAGRDRATESPEKKMINDFLSNNNKWSDGDSFYKVDVTVFRIANAQWFVDFLLVQHQHQHNFFFSTQHQKENVKMINKWRNESFLAGSSFSSSKYLHNVQANIYTIMSLIGKMGTVSETKYIEKTTHTHSQWKWEFKHIKVLNIK